MDGARELSGDLAERLERGAAVITGNQRAARTLRRAYDHWCHALGLSAWRPPVILAWETWIAALWRQAVLDGHATQLLLTATQEHAIWREILLAGEWKSLRNADSLAAMASEAWSLLCRYNAQHRLRQIGGSADTLAFRRWAQQFVESCQGENFIAAAQLEEALSGIVEVAAATADLSLPKEIVLAGFDTMSPSRMAFIDVIQASGIAVEEISIGTASQKRLLIEAKDEQEETRAAARWIRQYLEEHPHAQIGVIVPNTEERRASVERVFREILAPELENIAATNDSAPYEFSLGVPLIRTPMVATALRLLQWAKNALPLDDISQMLLSRYFAWSEEERGARAEFDAFVLRQARLLRPEATLRWLLARMEGHEKIATLRAAVRKMEAVRAQRFASGERRPYAEWAARIGEFLDAAAWGARNDENSVEYQTRRKWEGALDEFASLDFRAERVEFAEALARLEWIVQNTMFATESRGAAVQVMGPLEAAGSRFDALWFLGAGEFTWPPPARSHPLLPWHLQRECKMPGANRACDDALAARITQRLAESAETVVFSYAAEAERGHQRPSPALAGLDLQAEPLPREPERTPVALERVEDSTPLPPLPDEVIHGGTEVLRLQAACGFRAFAERRLWSTELDENDLGLDAAERGTILHRALQNFWSEVRSQEALKALSNDELEAAILRSVDAAFRKIDSQNGTPWEKSYVDLQRRQLRGLLRQWMEEEKNRQLFHVEQLERELKDARIGPLRLDVRIDRIDAGAEGDILIDYKTGKATPNEWLGDRPDAPQLPLYAVLTGEEPGAPLEAVKFALVRAGEMKLKGLPDSVNLEEQVESWRVVLENLARDFAEGDARVNPKSYPKTCQYCAQRILCRLDPSSLEEVEEQEAEEDERG